MNTTLPKLILICSLLLIGFNASATDYYFSNEIGNDSRSASQAQNPNTPWKSINKLNAIFSSLRSGDAIFFKRGEVYHGTINITKGGSAGNPIRIDAYGSGSKPIITSFEKVTGWKSIGNGRYESSNSFSNYETNVVSINGEVYEEGRYPNSDQPNGGYLTISSYSGNSSVSSKELNNGINYSNAEIVLKKNQWVMDRHPINSSSGGTVNFAGSGKYSTSEGYGFFIQNHLSTLDKFGEWFYSNGRKLSVYFGNTDPNNSEVLVSTLENLVSKSYNVSHILIQSLHFKGANKDAIYIGEGRDITINNSDIEYSGENGITSLNIKDLKITNCSIKFSLNSGMNLRYGNDNAIIKDNIIENSFPFPGGAQNEDNNGNGILVAGDNALVENNIVKRTGFNGIHFTGNNVTIKNNLIQEFCGLKNDCGGIYTWGGQNVQTFSNRTIENNIVVDAAANNNGTPRYDSPTYDPHGSGIFLDDNVNGVVIIKNTIANTKYAGIKASNGFNLTIRDNTFYNSKIQVLVGNSNRGADTRNVNISNNVFFSKYSDQYSYRLNSFKDDIASFGYIDNNYFARPLGDDHSIYVSYYRNNVWYKDTKNLVSWNSDFKHDQSSNVFQQNEIKQFKLKGLIGGLLYDNLSFDNGIDDFNCNDCSQSWDSNGISGGSIKIKSPAYSSALVKIGSVDKDKSYVVNFKAKSNKRGYLRVLLRYAGTPWEVISPATAVELGTEVKEYSVLIEPYADVPNPVVMFISDVGNWEYWIDDLEIKEADVEITDPDKVFLFEYNASKNKKSIPLNGDFKDVKGSSYSGNIDIQPYSSVLLVRTSEASSPIKIAPQEINIISPNTNSSYAVGEEINIEAEVTPNNDNISKIEFYNGDELIGSDTGQPYKLTWKSGSEGTYQIKAVIVNKDNNNIASSSPISVKINGVVSENDNTSGSGFALHVNVGATNSEVYEGKTFVPLSETNVQNQFYNSRELDNNSEGSIFKSFSFNEVLIYRIPMPNGVYTLQTFHQEVHFGLNGVTGGNGRRVFDIILEDEVKYKDLDLYSLNENRKVVLTHENIEVNDGFLDLRMPASENNAIISAFSIVEKIPIQSVEGARYINVGDTNDEEYQGNLFVSDFTNQYYSSSGTSENTNNTPEPMFQTIRFAQDLIYRVPVEDGVYRVKTYHIENYFGATIPNGREGLRVFDIFIQNELVKSNLDLFATNGNNEITLVFDEIVVNNGELKIELNASVNNALLAGIAIIPMNELYDQTDDVSYFINLGSEVSTEYNGINFLGESSLISIPVDSRPYIVPGSSPDQLYQSHRFGKSLEYEFPVPSGIYTIITYHNENYFGEVISDSGPNNRVFDIFIEGIKVKDAVDLYIENSNRPVALRFEEVRISDGVLNLNLNALVNNALISGIAIFPSLRNNLGNANLRQITTEADEMEILSEMKESGIKDYYENKIYPNPAVTSATLQIGQDLGQFYISIHNFNGQLIDYFDAEKLVTPMGTYEIPVHHLKQGVYIVTLSSETKVFDRLRLAVTP